MRKLRLCPTSLAQWHALVQDAEKAYGKLLSEDLENYLVILLQRFVDKPDIVRSVLALEYLENLIAKKTFKQEHLREVGDKCLLFSGLFPERAVRRRVNVSYFVELGQQSYYLLSQLNQKQTALAELFQELDRQFVCLMDTLQCMRELAGEQFSISPLQAEELWRRTGSQHAREVLRRYTDAMLVLGNQGKNKLH